MYSVRPLLASLPADLDALAGVFDLYRSHYGEPVEPGRSAAWLADELRMGRMRAFVADQDSAMVAFATAIEIPASLRLGHWWQIRDVFVVPEHRHRGVALALLDAVRSAAEGAGALRIGVQTEDVNDAALALYRRAGYIPVTGYRALTLSLNAA